MTTNGKPDVMIRYDDTMDVVQARHRHRRRTSNLGLLWGVGLVLVLIGLVVDLPWWSGCPVSIACIVLTTHVIERRRRGSLPDLP